MNWLRERLQFLHHWLQPPGTVNVLRGRSRLAYEVNWTKEGKEQTILVEFRAGKDLQIWVNGKHCATIEAPERDSHDSQAPTR